MLVKWTNFGIFNNFLGEKSKEYKLAAVAFTTTVLG